MLTHNYSRNKNKSQATKTSRKKNRKYHKSKNKKAIKPAKSPSQTTKIKQKVNSPQKLHAINNRVRAFFDAVNLTEIALETKFLIRQSPISPFIFLYALSMGLFNIAETSLDLLAINVNSIFKINITGAAFCQRMAEDKSVCYLKECFKSILNIQCKSAFKNGFGDAFRMFKGVILEDSTSIELNKKAEKSFKGSGGCASASALKMNWVFNICLCAVVAVDVFGGNVPDQKNATISLKHLKRGGLIIRDLGYFALSALRKIHEKGSYYLTRLQKNKCIYLNQNDSNAIDIMTLLKKITARGKTAKITVYIGVEERLPTQLISQKVPSWVQKKRLKKYKGKDGKKPSSDYVALANFSIFITNIPDDLWGTECKEDIGKMIIEIYKIRWQIELLFKQFKSVIKLHIVKGKSEKRILCLVYGKLISILMTVMILSYASSKKIEGKEVSLWKVTRWLATEMRLAKAILNGTFSSLYIAFLGDKKLLCKDRRKRKSTQEALEESFFKNGRAA